MVSRGAQRAAGSRAPSRVTRRPGASSTRRHGRRLRVWLASLPSGDPAASPEDVAAEAWLTAASKIGEFSGSDDDFAGWLFTIARLVLNNRRRAVQRRRTDAHEPGSSDARLGCHRLARGRGRGPGGDPPAARDAEPAGGRGDRLPRGGRPRRRRDGARARHESDGGPGGPAPGSAAAPSASSPTERYAGSLTWGFVDLRGGHPCPGARPGATQREREHGLRTRHLLAGGGADPRAGRHRPASPTSTSRWSAGSCAPRAHWSSSSPPRPRRHAAGRRPSRSTPTAAGSSRSATTRRRPSEPPSELLEVLHDPRPRLGSQPGQQPAHLRGLPTWVHPAVGAHRCPGFEVWKKIPLPLPGTGRGPTPGRSRTWL